MLNIPIEELDRLGIAVGNGVGAVNVDLGVYPPKSGPRLSAFDANLSENPYGEDVVCDLGAMSVLNHRYPNKNWLTMTGKIGRKHCWYGCTAALPLSEMIRIRYLNVGYRIGDGPMVWTGMPLEIDKEFLSDDRPCVAVRSHFELQNPDKPGMDIFWYEKRPDDGWNERGYHDGAPTVRSHGDHRLPAFTPAAGQGRSGWTLYNEVVRPMPHAPIGDGAG